MTIKFTTMLYKKISLALLLCYAQILFGQQSSNTQQLTECIRYDVPLTIGHTPISYHRNRILLRNDTIHPQLIKQKNSPHLQDLNPAKRKALINTICDKVLNGKISAYDALVKHIKISREDLSGETVQTTINDTVRLDQVEFLRFHEAWYFDPVNFTFEKKVKGVILMIDDIDGSGQIKGIKPQVYVRFNEK